jgi:hypothetical protein
MNDLLLIGTAIFFIGTIFYIVNILSDTKHNKQTH